MKFAITLEPDAKNVVERGIVPKTLGNLQHALFALGANDNIYVPGFEGLLGGSDGCEPPRITG